MCYWLVEGLVARGHDVTVIGAGRPQTSARFVQTYPEPPSTRVGEALPELVHASQVARALEDLEVDLVHDNSMAGPLVAAGTSRPTLVTVHIDARGEAAEYYRNVPDNVCLVAISDAQRRGAPDLPWIATVRNAIPVDEYPFDANKDDYVLFLGRLSPEKGAHLAIEAAREAGWPLIMAGKCTEPRERAYLNSEIRPRLGPDVQWIGEADTEAKKNLLVKARCLVFPIQWQEPFGIVMVEAMACGTPVVALRGGSVEEVVHDEVTGFVCDKPSALAEAIKRSELIDPHQCRNHARSRFDVERMVSGYESTYYKLLDEARGNPSFKS